MRLTVSQAKHFWREWSAACRAQQWAPAEAANAISASEIETERHNMLERAGFSSLKHVDPGKGFTAVLKELAQLQQNIAGMIRADGNARRQTIWIITHKSDEAYWRSIAKDKFGNDDLDSMSEQQLEQLRNTLADRQVLQHRHMTTVERRQAGRRRRSQPRPEPRASFPTSDFPAPAAPPAPDDLSDPSDPSDSEQQPIAAAINDTNPF